MTIETYDDLKRFVGSKNDFTDDLLNMGYAKGYGDAKRAFRDINVKSIQEYEAEIRAKTIDECFKAIREQAEKALRKQNQERHDKGLPLYQQEFDCFSTHKIEFDIFREAEKQMKGETK